MFVPQRLCTEKIQVLHPWSRDGGPKARICPDQRAGDSFIAAFVYHKGRTSCYRRWPGILSQTFGCCFMRRGGSNPYLESLKKLVGPTAE